MTAVRKSGRFGLSVLAPDSEYDRIRSLAERHRFERSHVYRRVEDGLCFLLCVFEGSGDEAVVFVPAYASETDLDMLYPLAQEAGEMPVLVRPLEYEECVTLTVADPDLFFCPGQAGDRDGPSRSSHVTGRSRRSRRFCWSRPPTEI